MSNKIEATQRNANRSQSTVDFQRNNIFTFGSRFYETVYLNNTGGDLTIKAGSLVLRDIANDGQTKPAIAGATLVDVIGILAHEGESTLTDTETIQTNYAIGGNIDASLLIFPATVSLDTVVGNKTVKDILTDLGFVLENVTENTKFDN